MIPSLDIGILCRIVGLAQHLRRLQARVMRIINEQAVRTIMTPSLVQFRYGSRNSLWPDVTKLAFTAHQARVWLSIILEPIMEALHFHSDKYKV